MQTHTREVSRKHHLPFMPFGRNSRANSQSQVQNHTLCLAQMIHQTARCGNEHINETFTARIHQRGLLLCKRLLAQHHRRLCIQKSLLLKVYVHSIHMRMCESLLFKVFVRNLCARAMIDTSYIFVLICAMLIVSYVSYVQHTIRVYACACVNDQITHGQQHICVLV